MANIGRVFRDSYMKGSEKIKFIAMDIRTISIRKKFTISVNKNKYPDGVINGNIAQGKEEYADYNIWTNLANRGESGYSEIVGNIRDAVSDNGLAYKRAVLFDPFIQKENIYFTLFSVDDDKKKNENHLYNVVAQPYRNMNNSTESNQPAQPTYSSATPQQSQAYDTANDIHENIQQPQPIDADNDEIPF